MTGDGYVIIHGPLAGIGPSMYEAVPFSEALPSPDGEFWRCKRPDGSRRCFFAPQSDAAKRIFPEAACSIKGSSTRKYHMPGCMKA